MDPDPLNLKAKSVRFAFEKLGVHMNRISKSITFITKAVLVLGLCFSSSAIAAAPTTNPKKIVFSFQKQKNPLELESTTQKVATELSRMIGIPVDVVVPSSYGVTAQGLISGTVHVAYMDSLPYILATQETDLEILVVEKRQGKTNYDSLILVGQNSPIKSLADLKGKRIAFASQTSTSGFLFPFFRMLKDKNMASSKDLAGYFSQIIYAGGYDKALTALASGQVDAAAMSDYAFEGPKADLYGTPDQRAKIRVLARTPGVPTHLIAVSKKLDAGLRSKIQDSLLKLAESNSDLVSSVYGAAELVKPDLKISHVQQTLDALKFTELTPQHFVK